SRSSRSAVSLQGGVGLEFRQERTQYGAIVLRRQARGIGLRQVQLDPPAVLALRLAAHCVQLVQASAQAPGLWRQVEFGDDAPLRQPRRQRLLQQVQAEAVAGRNPDRSEERRVGKG